jgi:hypothetical protein
MRKLHKIILTCLCVKFQISHTADITNANSKWHEERERAQRHQTHHDSLLPARDRRPCSPRLITAGARSPPLLTTTQYCQRSIAAPTRHGGQDYSVLLTTQSFIIICFTKIKLLLFFKFTCKHQK